MQISEGFQGETKGGSLCSIHDAKLLLHCPKRKITQFYPCECVQWNRCCCCYNFRTSKTAVEDQKKSEVALALEVDAARSRINEIQHELEQVVEQLGEAKVDKHETARATKKAELIDNLKRLFPGVVCTKLEDFGTNFCLHKKKHR